MSNNKLGRRISQFTFVQTSSFLMFFGINVSFFFFLLLIITNTKRLGVMFRLDTLLKIFVVFFMIGAILSTIHNFWEGNESALMYSLKVLPNYIYWGFIVLFFVMIARIGEINYMRIFRAITYALIVVLLYYTILQGYINNKWFFKYFGPNNFSLLVICYTPYLVYYTRKYIHPSVALLLLTVLLMVQLGEGRRAGFSLVLIGGLFSFFVPLFKFNSIYRLMRPLVAILAVWGLLSLGTVEKLIYSQSERVHQLIYTSSDDYLSEDRSALIRLAMIEKGFLLLEDNLLFGIGLNNFTKVEAKSSGNFKGSEYVMNKDIFQRISSHNSYINILAEGGLVLGVPFFAIFLLLLFKALRGFSRMKDPEKVVFFSFCVMCIHLYFTNGIVNSLSWFNIALMGYVISKPQRNVKLQPTR